MRYEDAAKIGTNVEGYVRCTYAKLHDIQNGFLFALQHHDAYKVTDAHLQASDYFDGERSYGGGAASEQVTQDVIERGANYSEFVEDVPVVKAIRPVTVWGGKKFVEVQLTDYCRDLLYRKIKSDYHYQTKYLVEKVWLKDVREVIKENGSVSSGKVVHKTGERQVMIDTFDREKAYTKDFLADHRTHGYMYVITEYIPFTAGQKSKKQEESVNELMNPDATFLVKEVAIDWFPTNMKGAFIEDPKTGKLVTIEVALDDARKRLDRAKAILAATTTLTIF